MKREIGGFAIPRAGHDQGKLYIIVGCEEGKYLLSDGKQRTLERPRRKQKKHLIFLHTKGDLKELFSKGETPVSNEDIKRAIRQYQTARAQIKQEVTDVQE